MSPNLKKACQQDTYDIVQACCHKGRQAKYGHQLASFVCDRNHNERAFAALAFLLMLKYESRDGIYAVVERMAVRVVRVRARARIRVRVRETTRAHGRRRSGGSSDDGEGKGQGWGSG